MVIRPTAIETSRFELVALGVEELRALIAGDTSAAGQLIGAQFPAVWPEERVVVEVDLPDGEVVGRAEPEVELLDLVVGEGRHAPSYPTAQRSDTPCWANSCELLSR